MARYIELDPLVAWAKETYLCENASMIRKVCYKQLLEHLDTLEAKEVDLEKEIDRYYNIEAPKEFEDVLYQDIEKFAKHFYELGLKIQKEPVSEPNKELAKTYLDVFDKVRKVMLYLDWKWDIGEGELTVPSTYRLTKKAESLLRKVATSYDSKGESKPRVCSCGGFTAEMVDGTLSLYFVLEEMCVYDDDYEDE